MASTNIEAVEAYSAILGEAASRSDEASKGIHLYLHGNSQDDVVTESGLVPSVAKQVVQARAKVIEVLGEVASQLPGATAYMTVEEGMDKTLPGGLFSVRSPSSDTYLDSYLNDNGVPKYQDSYPNKTANQKAISQSANALELVEPRMLSGRFFNGTFDARGNPINAVTREGVAKVRLDELPGLFFLSGIWRWVNVDGTGVVIQGIRWDGTNVGFGMASNSDVVAYQVNDSGMPDVWLLADNANFQITSSGVNWDPKATDGLIRYMSRAGTNIVQVQQEEPELGKFAAYIRKLLHIPSHGQSLSLGTHSAVFTTQYVVANRVFTTALGLRQSDTLQAVALDPASVLPLKPLVSTLQETPHTQLCASLARHRDVPADAGVIGSCHGVGATTIQNLYKGSVSYANLMTTVAQCKAYATARGYGYEVPFVDWIQGEANTNGSQGAYLTALLLLQSDLTTDIGAISGQPNIPLVLCQMSSWTTKNVTTSYVPHEQLQAALENPTKFICAGPKYWLDYHTDGVHLTGKGSVQLGAMHRAPAAAAIARKTWLPTHCTKAVRNGATVTLTFFTPEGPLVSDTFNVSDPGNLGIRWIDSAYSATVSSAQVNADNTVTVTLSAVPTGAAQKIGIADLGIAGALGGPMTGPRSCLRDSNTERDPLGSPFYNWACHQIISVE
ncbi:sialate O-acetylesterase [Pseudomonas taetrolens]|uniref:sialate O-acetylesterase n=1 Tax=Pseudomonas taetrolens TaxID=47884 RepID=UPI0030D95ABF